MFSRRWRRVELGAVIRLEYGSALPASSRSGDGFPVFGSNGEVGRHQAPYVNRPGIVVGRKGTVGAVAWSSQPFWPIDTTYFVEPSVELEQRWCYWLLKNLRLDRLDSSTGVPGLNRNDVHSIGIPFPPLPEQRRIAETLDTVDETIRQTEALIEKLNQVKRGMLHDLLTRGLDENGELRDPVAHPEQFKDSPLGRIPRGWEVVTIGELVGRSGGLVQTGPFGSQLHASEYVDQGVPVVMPQDIIGGEIRLAGCARIPERRAKDLGRHRVDVGDLLFSRRGDLGRCAAVRREEEGSVCGTGCLLVRVETQEFQPELLAATYRHYWSQRQVAAQAVGSTMVNLNTSILASLIVARPDTDEQRAIVERIVAVERRLKDESDARDKMRLVKAGLSQDLLTGRVRVSGHEEARESGLAAASA